MPTVKRQSKGADKPKRLRKRKARTDVSSSESDSSSDSSSSSSSDSESGSDTQVKKKLARKNDKKVISAMRKSQRAVSPTSSEDEQTSANAASKVADAKAEEAFTSFYLRQMTTEFAEDLDKIRSAGDFNDKSIGLLIGALKQGSGCFSKKERLDVGRAVVAADS